MTAGPRLATPAELETWDEHTVWTPGGHAYQSRTWGEQRARLGWAPLHVVLDADHRALVLLRRAPLVGSASGYIPRGPATADEDAPAAATRLIDLARWLASEHGVDVLASDAEVPASIDGYGRALRSAGFRPIPEIQPSRHRISLAIPTDADDEAIRAGLTKSTRQRIDRAARDGIVVTRFDGAGWVEDAGARHGGAAEAGPAGRAEAVDVADPDVDGEAVDGEAVDGEAAPTSRAAPLFAPGLDDGLDAALEGFADLLTDTGARRGFRFGPRQVFIDWWRAGIAAGMVVYLAAHDPAEPERTLGGLLLYRHGERLSTVHSGDVADIRERHPGIMHLLRWRAIQLAIREGRAEMDLGGVDVGPDHAEPVQGDPMAGLYEHKRSFGARWVSMTGAHERVARPARATLGRVATRMGRALGR